jgi:transcription elongation factor Elf1
MRFHGTAPSFAVGTDQPAFCPECRDLMVSATKSQHVREDVVRHWWSCESCGHEFRTTVKLPSIGAEAWQASVA